jgi:hypothetical protein
MTAEAQHHAWSRFVLWAVCSTIGLFLVLLGGLYLIDPYDTGRSPLSGESNLRGQKEVNATASVGRNQKFEAAVVGNSTIALIMPSQLTTLTGISFAQLSVPGAQVPEQLTVIDWFMKHHYDTAKALVISINRDTWCTNDPKQADTNPFPFWRFTGSSLEYVVGLLSVSSLEQAGRRLGLQSAKAEPAMDGYWDYEPFYAKLLADPPRRHEILAKQGNDQHGDPNGSFPAVRVLEQKLATLRGDLPVVLVFPPVFAARQPQLGTPRYKWEQACRAGFTNLASRRPNTAVVDWWIDRPEMKNSDLFIDQIHYRHPIARAIEGDIAAALRSIRERISLGFPTSTRA